MNWFQKWIVDAVFQIFKQLKHIEHKQDLLSQHLGVTLPPELVKAGNDLADKTKALQAALDAQAKSTPQEQQPI